MTMASTTSAELAEALEALRAQMAEMAGRLEILEARQGGVKDAQAAAVLPPAAAAPAPSEPAPAEISEEELLAISAAIGAFLGVRAHIRQIRLVSSNAWAQQGRVSIQASHRLQS